MMVYDRGDICLVNFNPAKGGEIGKMRPAIIMSTIEESSVLETVIVIPLSTYIEADSLPYRYLIKKRDKLKSNSDACIYEIRALSKMRIKEKLGKLTKIELNTIQKALCDILG
jgi:mRNA interferase MazF